MRAGRIIADTTPDGLLADTGEVDPDAAFLTLIERDATGDPSAGAGPDPQHPLTRRELRETEDGE
jgi:ABC-2 type transport system ATP-binding protein